jgi:hypothetical protein
MTGTYLNLGTGEVVQVAGGAELPEGEWKMVSEDATLGLLAIRRLVAKQGLVDDPETLFWHMPQPPQSTAPLLPCPPDSGRRTGPGFLARLFRSHRDRRRPPRPSPHGGAA